MCSKFAKYGLGIVLLALAGVLVGAALSIYGFIALWWPYPAGWEALAGLNGQPQELLTMRVPDGPFFLKTAAGEVFACEKGAECVPSSADWRGDADTRPCSASTRPWVTSLFPLALNWNARVLGCEVGYQGTGRNVFVLQAETGKSFATYGVIFLPTDAGVIIVGLLGGLVGAFGGGAAGVLAALVLLASAKKKNQAPFQ